MGSLFEAQRRIFAGNNELTVFDVGAQLGDTTEEYLREMPRCRVFAFEPAPDNFETAKRRLAPYGGRVELLPMGVSDSAGKADLQLTSHNGSHSLLRIGEDKRWFDSPIENIGTERIDIVTIDGFCAERGIDRIDILKMDIQGGELRALKGAERSLSRGAIGLIALEVLFQPLYQEQPSFWALAEHLRGLGYALQGIHEAKYHDRNHAILRWADAIFVSPETARIDFAR
jgi:FkbM family methyltransferase